MKPTTRLHSFLIAVGSSLLAVTFASAQTPLVANGTTAALSLTTSNSTNYSITGSSEQNSYNGVIRNTSGNNILSGNVVLNSPSGGIRFDTAAGTLTFSGNISQTGTSRNFLLTPASGSSITVNNPIANNGGALLTGASGFNGTAGTVILKGVNGVGGIGTTTIFQGSTLQLGVSDALNTTANLTIGVNSANPASSDIGTFNLASFNQTVNALGGATSGGANAAASNRRVINSVAGTAILTVGNGGGSGTFNGQINTGTGNIQLIKTGAGNQTLTGNNSYTGGTRIDAGTLTLGHSTDTLANGGAINVNGGTLAIGANSDTVGAVTLTSGSITGSGGTLTGTGSAYDVRSGSASAILGGSVGLTKTTSGTVILTGVNTYSGTTNINNGVLAVNGTGSINGSAVTINGGEFNYNSSANYTGTLTFTSGTISGTNMNGSLSGRTIGLGQTIAPGNSPGTATTGSQTWASAGSYEWEINSTTGTVGLDPGWDLIDGSGALIISASAGNEFNINVTSLTVGNMAGSVFNFDDTLSYNWLIADFASISGFDAGAFNLDTSAFSNPFTGNFGITLGTGVLGGDDSQIYLTYTAIPEPSAALLGGLGLLALLRRRR